MAGPPDSRCPCASIPRTALQDALRRLLGLFGEMLKAASALKSRISERVGLGLTPSAGELQTPGR